MGTSGLGYWKSIVGNLSTGREGQAPHIFSEAKTDGQLSAGDSLHTKILPTVFVPQLFTY